MEFLDPVVPMDYNGLLWTVDVQFAEEPDQSALGQALRRIQVTEDEPRIDDALDWDPLLGPPAVLADPLFESGQTDEALHSPALSFSVEITRRSQVAMLSS